MLNNNIHNTSRLVTGGGSSRDAADVQMHSSPVFWLGREAGGPLDAPAALPAGSCNSMEWRTGPWNLNGGAGRNVAAQTSVTREGTRTVYCIALDGEPGSTGVDWYASESERDKAFGTGGAAQETAFNLEVPVEASRDCIDGLADEAAWDMDYTPLRSTRDLALRAEVEA